MLLKLTMNLQIQGKISSHIFIKHTKEKYRMFRSVHFEHQLDQSFWGVKNVLGYFAKCT